MNSNNIFNHEPCEAYFDGKGNLIVKKATMFWYANLSARDINGAIPASPEEKDRLRSFKIFIDDPEFAQSLSEDGWSISMTKPDEDGNVRYLLKCKVSYRFFEPRIVRIDEKTGNRVDRTVESVHQIDNDAIVNGSVAVKLRPSRYRTKAGKEGYSAYVEEMYYVAESNGFDELYQTPVVDYLDEE